MIELRRLFLTLQRDERGAVALVYLISLPLIILMLLGSVDFIRYSMAQSKLQNALDIAAISAGRRLENFTTLDAGSDEEKNWKADAAGYFYSNMPERFLGSTIDPDSLTIHYEDGDVSGQLVDMSAEGSLPLIITGLSNRTAFDLGAQNQAVRRTRSDIEMVLALDHTGSMNQENRVGVLKSASQALVTTLLAAARNAGNPDKTFIGIVPFADTVYVGEERRRWLTGTAQNYPYIKRGNIWDGCVVEPYENGLFKAEPGSPGQFEPLMTWGTQTVSVDSLKAALQLDDNEKLQLEPNPQITSEGRGIDARVEDNGIALRFAFRSQYRQWRKHSQNCSSSRNMIFLSNNEQALKQSIADLSVDGRTIIPLGLLWSWRMLDPGWRSADDASGWGDANKPRTPTMGLNKIIVLLTDGNNGLDPINPRYESMDDVAIDGNPEKINGVDYTVRFNYSIEGKPDSSATASYSGTLTNFSSDHHFINKYFANSSDFHSLHIASEEEMRDGTTARLEPYGALYQGRNNGQDWEVGNKTLNALTQELCENIKSKDIRIYTVVLGRGINASTNTLMQNCSSGAQGGYYYNATNVNNLPAAFSSIAESLTELRLNK